MTWTTACDSPVRGCGPSTSAAPSYVGLVRTSADTITPTEQRALRAAYGDGPDPYYNPNLSAWDSFAPRSEAPHLIPATPAEPVRVLFATHNLTAFEGAPKIIQDVAAGLTRRGAVEAAVYAPAPGKAAAAYEAAGVRVFAGENAVRRAVRGRPVDAGRVRGGPEASGPTSSARSARRWCWRTPSACSRWSRRPHGSGSPASSPSRRATRRTNSPGCSARSAGGGASGRSSSPTG